MENKKLMDVIKEQAVELREWIEGFAFCDEFEFRYRDDETEVALIYNVDTDVNVELRFICKADSCNIAIELHNQEEDGVNRITMENLRVDDMQYLKNIIEKADTKAALYSNRLRVDYEGEKYNLPLPVDIR